MRNFFDQILMENGGFSLTRIIIISSFALFSAVSLFLLFTNLTFDYYETFAYITAFSFTGGGLGNKFINSKFNSVQGGYESVEPECKTNVNTPLKRATKK